MSEQAWLVYGANGSTGRLIVQEALRRGHRPILAGRNAQKLKLMAEEFGLEWLAFDLANKAELEKALSKVKLVLNVAGPFEQTAILLAEACIVAGVNYLDVANEIEVFLKLYEYDAAARQQNIALISGVGFGTVATNFLVKRVAEQLSEVNHLEIVIAAYNNQNSLGASKTTLEAIAGGGKVYENNRLVSFRLGKGAKKLPFPDGTARTVLPVPIGDLVAAYRATGIPNIKVYLEYPSNVVTRLAMPVVQRLLNIKAFRNLAEKSAERSAKNPTPQVAQEATKHSYSWVGAKDKTGKSAQAWLEMGEGYQFTAFSSVQAVERVLQDRPAGALTPVEAFGPDFVLGIEGVRVIDSTIAF